MKKARKTEGRLADPSYFPWELRRVCSPHEVLERRALVESDRHEVLGWEEETYNVSYTVPVWEDLFSQTETSQKSLLP